MALSLPFDIHGLTAVFGVMYLLLGLTVWGILYPRHDRVTVNMWTGGALLLGGGILLVVWRDYLPTWLSFGVANIMMFGGYAARVAALRRDLRLVTKPWVVMLVWLAISLGYVGTLQAPTMSLRMLYGFLFHALGAFAVAVYAWRLAGQHRSLSARMLGGMYYAFSVALLLRLIALATYQEAGAHPLAPTWDSVLVVVTGLLSAVYGNLGYLGVVLDRTQAAERRQRDAWQSERHEREQAQAQAQRLRDLLHQRDQLSRERDRLLRLLAHEVRQPLHNACGALESARNALVPQCDTCSGHAVVERMARAQAVLSTVQSVLDNTLTAASLLNRREPLAMQDVDVDLLIALTLGDFDDALRTRVRVSRETSLRSVELDLGLMRVALRNLLRNAFTHGGSGVAVTIKVEERCQPPAFVLSVCDDGPGLPAVVWQRMGEDAAAEVEADPAPASASSGSGLGLQLVRRIVQLHGGQLQLAANQPRGTCVSLVIPLEFED